MQILTVKIRNFRCFKSINIDFEKCHAIVGENGSGKTAILEAINIATSATQGYLSEQDFNNSDLGDIRIEVIFNQPFIIKIPDGYTTQNIPCKSVCFTGKRRSRATPGKAFSEPFVTEKVAIPIIYDNITEIPDIDKYKHLIPAKVEKTEDGYSAPRKSESKFKFTVLQLTYQNEMEGFPNVFYFDKDREDECRIGYNTTLNKVAKDLNWKFRSKWNQTDIINKWHGFYNEVINTVEDAKNSRIIIPIKNKLLQITGKNFQNLELSLFDIEQPFSKSFFSDRENTNQIEQTRLGSGISILLSYALLHTASSFSKEDLILLVDEPELHLHPQLQSNLFEEFRNSLFQTIYTTQSDSFIDVSEWRSITRISPDFLGYPNAEELSEILDGMSVTTHLDEIKKWHQHRCIFFKEDNQLFFASKCVLVEGPAEKYGLPILAKVLDIDLTNLTIISCNGKSKIPYYQLLCKTFSIPYYTVYDLDNKTVTDRDNKRLHRWSESKAITEFSTSFEQLLGFEEDVEHKTNELLIMIDSILEKSIPEEIKRALSGLERWSKEQ